MRRYKTCPMVGMYESTQVRNCAYCNQKIKVVAGQIQDHTLTFTRT